MFDRSAGALLLGGSFFSGWTGDKIFLLGFFLLSWGFPRLATRWRDSTLRGRKWFLFRAFFPNWRFFDAPGEIPCLEFRGIHPNGQEGQWEPCFLASNCLPKKTLVMGCKRLFLNPEGNLFLARQSLLQQFADEVSDLASVNSSPSQVRSLTAYALVSSWVESVACSRGYSQSQFRLRILSPETQWEEVLVSPWEPVVQEEK